MQILTDTNNVIGRLFGNIAAKEPRPLGSCQYQVVSLTEQVVKEILPAGDTLKNGIADVLTSAVIWEKMQPF